MKITIKEAARKFGRYGVKLTKIIKTGRNKYQFYLDDGYYIEDTFQNFNEDLWGDTVTLEYYLGEWCIFPQ